MIRDYLNERLKFHLSEAKSSRYGRDKEYDEVIDFRILQIEASLAELEELEFFKSEHLRLEAELNTILHPNGDGPTAPSFCDLVAYVQADVKPKTCNTCAFDHCGCSVQDDVLRYYPNAKFDTFGCTAHELRR